MPPTLRIFCVDHRDGKMGGGAKGYALRHALRGFAADHPLPRTPFARVKAAPCPFLGRTPSRHPSER